MYELSLFETQKAIKFIKDTFQNLLSTALNLHRISGPIILEQNNGINDDLNGVESPVRFESSVNNLKGEVPQSLAKWKRYVLKKYDVPVHEGIYVDMNAIRKDEQLSYKHSIYVDQWDWELRINKNERNLKILKKVVSKIYEVIVECQKRVYRKYSWPLNYILPEKIVFITSQELLDKYPNCSPKEREDLITKEHKAVFIIGIGHKLSDGLQHDNRSPDYDDWNLNGDILVWDNQNSAALELSSMGIRVDSNSLIKQLEIKDQMNKLEYQFHKELASDLLPFSIGGGIGQSRLCYFMLNKKHISEVQVSIWPDDIKNDLKSKKINYL